MTKNINNKNPDTKKVCSKEEENDSSNIFSENLLSELLNLNPIYAEKYVALVKLMIENSENILHEENLLREYNLHLEFKFKLFAIVLMLILIGYVFHLLLTLISSGNLLQAEAALLISVLSLFCAMVNMIIQIINFWNRKR